MLQKKPQKKPQKNFNCQVNKCQIIKQKLVTKRKQAYKCKQAVKKSSSYSIYQKREVVTYAKQHGRNKAARHFELNGSMVGRWMKTSTCWTTETKSHSLRIGSGRKAFYPEAEEKLYNWVIEQRKQGLAVISATIKITMLKILEEPDMIALYGNITESFKGSVRWLYLFMKRHKLSLRWRTKYHRSFQNILKNY